MNPNGIGLGLSICNKILAAMGSKLQVESEYNVGSRFYFAINLSYNDAKISHKPSLFLPSISPSR